MYSDLVSGKREHETRPIRAAFESRVRVTIEPHWFGNNTEFWACPSREMRTTAAWY